jgi:hypothetical protein
MKYIDEFLELNVEELNEEDLDKLLFLSVGVLSEIILEKKYYSHNKDLKDFANEILTQDYKDYLFDARPALYARIIRDLRKYKIENPEMFFNIEKSIQKFIAGNPELNAQPTKPKSSSEKKKKSNPKIISDWRSIIESER